MPKHILFSGRKATNRSAIRPGKRTIFFLVLLLSYAFLSARKPEIEFNKVVIEVDGEEVFDVVAMVQDHLGFLWLGCNLGLIRYDGIDARSYNDRIRGPLLEEGDIRVLFVDSRGELWIGGNSGLSKYNSDCDCILGIPSGRENEVISGVTAIAEGRNNELWIGTLSGALYRFNKDENTITRVRFEPAGTTFSKRMRINCLLSDRNQNLWIGTAAPEADSSAGLIRYNTLSGEVRHFAHDPARQGGLTDNRISAIYEDRQGYILIGTYKAGFHVYKPGKDTLLRIMRDESEPDQILAPYSEEEVMGGDPFVQIIHQDQNGNYWAGTTGKGVNYLDRRNGKRRNFNFSLVNPQLLFTFYEDRQGNVWIGGVLGAGLFKADLYKRSYGLNTNFDNVEAAYESPLNPGILWVKSRQGGLARMNLNTKEVKRYLHQEGVPESIGNNWVRSAYQEDKKTLWLGLGTGGAFGGGSGDGGIDRMDIETERFVHFKLLRDDDERNDFSHTVYSICEDEAGHLWLGTGPGGIFRSDREKKTFRHFDGLKADSQPGSTYMNLVFRDSDGRLWASDFKGEGTLYLYDYQKQNFKPFLRDYRATNVVIDDSGRLLISTWSKGLLRLNPVDGSLTQYTKSEGLPSNEALDIVKGDDGIFWIGTRMGPSKFDAKSGKISSLGLPKGRYNYGIFRTMKGEIYLGAHDGLVFFFPDQVRGNPYPPQLMILELLISGENVLKTEEGNGEIKLSHRQNDIVFKYCGLHFSNAAKNMYQYRLKPLDEAWTDASTERTARYANLPPGSYTFEVRASNSDGVWTEGFESVQFSILPAWWTTWWAYLIYVALILLISERFYRFQLSKKLALAESARLKEVNRLKNSLYTNITHEFRTPLTVILGMADSIRPALADTSSNHVEDSLEMIKRNGRKLLRLINEMLDLSKLESGNMELQMIQGDVIPFVKYLGESFQSLAAHKEINLTIYSEVDELLMDFDANKLSVVVSNVLSNAIKFTPPGGKIIVHFSKKREGSRDFFLIKIQDSGPGIPAGEIKNIFKRFYQVDNSDSRLGKGTGIGLALARENVELMNGDIEAVCNPGKGSLFIIRLPVSRQAPFTRDVRLGMDPDILPTSADEANFGTEVEAEDGLPLALIIEDNADVTHYLKTCLAGKYRTLHAENGEAGIECALEKIPDVIISDVMMPVMDGFEVCSILKSDERTDHIPVILLTAKVGMKDKLTGLSRGADAYLTKPFDKTELLTRLDQLVLLRKKLMQKMQGDGLDRLMKKRAEDPETRFIQKIVLLIHEEISGQTFGSSADLARKMNLSESQLYRKLKAITGKSTAIFIRSVRLQKAKELIRSTDKNISEIAYETGFNDPSWFSRAFKEEFGFPPSDLSEN